jgi:GntR family transcriptional regulator
MLIVLDHHSGIPVYRQLMDQIKFHVASGLLNSGDELPSTRSLSTRLGLNPMTVSKAYSLLEREGVLDRRPGLPLVVRSLETDKMQAQKLEQLRQSLEPTVTMVHQLGIEPDKAAEVFQEMIDGQNSSPAEEKS